MNAITQAIVDGSTLEVTHIKITNATKTSFLMSIESKVANTGPVGATMTPMTVEMHGSAGCFGKLDLPEIKTSSSGTTVTVKDQKIEIIDMAAFVAFNKSIMNDEELILHLKNGQSTIKAMFMSAQITYNKDVKLKGMNGPKNVMTKTEVDGNTFKNTMLTINPSPLEIDLGTLREELRNSKGEKIGEQSGKVYLNRGETSYVMTGTTTGTAADAEIRIIGLGVEEDHWGNQTIINMDTTSTVTPEFTALCAKAA